MLSDVPPHVTLTKEQYDALVENDEIDENTYYHIVGDDETYVLQSELESNYYTKTGVQSYVASAAYTKQEIDNLIQALSFYTQE
jgi:heat shock protein HspQ